MGRTLRTYVDSAAAFTDLERVRAAVSYLRSARAIFLCVGAHSTRKAVVRAIKSAEGAERHAERVYRAIYYEERRREGTA